MAHGDGMQGESRALSDARAVRRGAGRDGVWSDRLAPGVGTDGDSVVDGGEAA